APDAAPTWPLTRPSLSPLHGPYCRPCCRHRLDPAQPSRRATPHLRRRVARHPSRPTARDARVARPARAARAARATRAAQQSSSPSRPSRPAVEQPEPPEPPSCLAVVQPLHLPLCPGPTYSAW
ncbi:unnamed protein product, partial [Closterium sp. NIES-53]